MRGAGSSLRRAPVTAFSGMLPLLRCAAESRLSAHNDEEGMPCR